MCRLRVACELTVVIHVLRGTFLVCVALVVRWAVRWLHLFVVFSQESFGLVGAGHGVCGWLRVLWLG